MSRELVKTRSGMLVPAVELRSVPLVQYREETVEEACIREIENTARLLRGKYLERLRREAHAAMSDYVQSSEFEAEMLALRRAVPTESQSSESGGSQ